ncbi:pyruvate formate lyase family protein [uncultured Victivallis sp.]|uniref:pyruvate formate lyase family protein n=1 Tax=uncultured Victivallis sp. TaxID=354118 RepID=UPI0025F9BFC9|nr:pyruvate formate lyase family protein [uncultured Victivallis sp.]
MKYAEIKREWGNYYRGISSHCVSRPFNPLKKEMDAFAEANPGLSPMMLKAGQYEIIADKFIPVLLPHNPFFFETGLKMAEYDGCVNLSSGGWLYLRNVALYSDSPEKAADYRRYCYGDLIGLHLSYGPYYDYDHHCFPFSNMLELGLSGILKRLEEGRAGNTEPEKAEFYEAARRGILAVRKIAEKFAAAAEEKLASAESPEERKNLERIRTAARRIPWNPPQTFYEGLECLWFFHELGSVLDGIGMSVLGSPDRQLIRLYRRDIQEKRLTEAEAYELICLYMLQTDSKLDFDRPIEGQFNAGEQGDTLILGGLDESGNDVTNELTFLFLKAHRELKLTYPKIHIRFSSRTPAVLFQEAAKDFLADRNVLSFLNDDIVIPSQIMAGKTPESAARYVAGGCWENILEGYEHSQGANSYFSLGKCVDLSIHEENEDEKSLELPFRKLDGATSFEGVYSIVMDNIKLALHQLFSIQQKYGALWTQVNPCPFFSACLNGCAESGRDYSAGGACYSPHGIPFTGVAVLVDSLLALKTICFGENPVPLPRLLAVIRNDWRDAEALRCRAMASPHLGDGKGEAARLTARILNDLADYVAGFRNELGGIYQCGLYSYRDIIDWAKVTRATPDGRRAGDFLSQGLTPARTHADAVTQVFSDTASLPLLRFPANSVLTLSLSKNGLTEALLSGFLKAWVLVRGSGMLQLNCISREELEDAQKNPQNHASLIVRLYGYSAKFITLSEEKQREFISRNIY